jgi:hypothetical protein
MAVRLAQARRVVVVVDSLDVLSLHREHGSLRLFLGILDRLERVSNIRVAVACRTFDLDYDPLLRGREWHRKLALRPLDYAAVVLPLLGRHGIPPPAIGADLAELLRVPENLRLLVDIAASGEVPTGLGEVISAQQLQDLYLDRVVARDPLLGNQAIVVLGRMAAEMIAERALYRTTAAVSAPEPLVHRLISQGVLIEPSPGRVQFGHQTLLDALAVREALARGQTLTDFILANPPFPFLRPAVRGFAAHLRARMPDVFPRQVRETLQSEDVAYHLKRTLVESLAEVTPTDGDWPIVRFLWHQSPLFRGLESADDAAMWRTAAEVFAANLGTRDLSKTCRAGLMRILRREPPVDGIVGLLDRYLQKWGLVEVALIEGVIDAVERRIPNVSPSLTGMATKSLIFSRRKKMLPSKSWT